MSRANRGKGWESRLDHQHRQYRDDRRAVMFRAHPATKVVGGRAIREKAPPDFFGVLTGGTPILFDAKSHQGGRLPFGQLKLHQAMALEAWQVSGGVAGIMLRLEPSRGDVRTFWVDWRKLGPPWWDWHEKRRHAQASVALDWLAIMAADLNGGTDWLEVVL